MSMKRTRHIKKWFITIPRVAIREPGVYQIKLKISQVVIEKTKDLPGEGKDRGSIDSDEKEQTGKDSVPWTHGGTALDER